MQEGIFKTIGMCFVLCTAVLFVYSPVQQYDFISFDDYSYVVNNQHIQQGITLESIAWALTAVCEATWQPLVWLSYMIDYQLYGLDPGGYHLTNVLLHIGNVLLLFMLLQKMTGAFWKPAWVAALFALHPIHVESVAWIAERKDVLSTLMLLLTVLSYAGYVKRPGCLGYLRTCLLFLLGLMSKPMLVTLPFVLLLLDFWPLGRFDSSGESGFAWCRRRVVQLVIEKVPLFSIAAGSAVLTWWAQQDAGAVSSLEAVPLGVRFLNALMSYVLYMGNMVWPSGLAVFYPYSAKLPVLALWGSG
ncbi:MAG: hypothetical protein GY868_07430, partial [Deltaproteobacteria bacterium]|nr:hypothetical protein [Deltaproteobacteria bacterium]